MWRFGSINQRANPASNKEIFTAIYEENKWGNKESVSGAGATREQTKALVEQVNRLLTDLKVEKVLDVPCGDFNWMQQVNLSHRTYRGGDVVQEIIDANNLKYGRKEGIRFFQCDLTTDTLPKGDMIINRDCLVHLSYEHIRKALKNMQKSGSTYLLTTTFTDHPLNFDIPTGSWRTLNLEKKPFYFPKPITLLNEECTEDGGLFRDKCLGLWKLADLPV